MATTPRGPRSGITGSDERDTLNPMQEPLGSMDRPGSRTSDINEVNLPPGETVRRTGNLGTSNTPGARTTTTATRNGRGFGSTFVIAAAVLVVAFLIALYLGSNRSNVATVPSAQPPVAETTPNGNGATGDQTGSTTAPSQQEAPAAQQTAPGTGDAGGTGTGTGTGGSTTAPANP